MPFFLDGHGLVGGSSPTFIVAEIGINHNGDLDTALQLIDAAVRSGADAVKFQKRNPDISVPQHMRDQPKDTPWGMVSYLEYKHRMEFWQREYDVINRHCRNRGILWFASPWDAESVGFLDRYELPCYKIASAGLTDDALLSAIASRGRPIIASTGMSTKQEIDHAVRLLRRYSVPLALLHCNSSYPCKPADLNLRCIRTLLASYPDCEVGYSGHEVGLQTTVAAVALGACIVERHITLSRAMWGTDQAASVEPQGFERLIRDIRTVEAALGDGEKRVTDAEKAAMQKLRRVGVS